MNYEKYLLKNGKNLKGKNIIVTGATGGIGKEFCRFLAQLNANIILVSRNLNKLNEFKNELLNINKNILVNIVTCDFLDINDVKKATDELMKYKIDYLVHNAGAYALPIKNTSFNYNNVFQINAIVPFYMSKKLIDNIKENKGKIIFVSSITSNYNHIDKNDIQFLKHRPICLYGNSKRVEVLSLTTLFNEYEINYSIVHPGVSYTNITSNYKNIIHKIIKYPMKLIFISNKKAALNLIFGLFNDVKYPNWVGPKYFNIWGKPNINKCKVNDNNKYIYDYFDKIYDKIETL